MPEVYRYKVHVQSEVRRSGVSAKEADHGKRVEREPITGVRAPAGLRIRGQSPLKVKAFHHLFSYKKDKSLVFKLKKTPYVWSIWGPAARSAHSWIHQ